MTERSIEPREVLWLDGSSTWMDPIHTYVTDGTLPPDTKEADQVNK